MLVNIINHDLDPTTKVLELTSICHPYIDVDKLNRNETTRLIRKLIRQKDIILQSVHVLFKFKCPIFVYNEMRIIFGNIKFTDFYFDVKDLTFESSDNFNDKQMNQISCLYKKAKNVIKNISDVKKVSTEDLYYCLPMGTIVEYSAYVDFLQIFEMGSHIITNGIHPKTKETIEDVFDLVVNEFPDFFTKQNLEIFTASKEI